MKYLAVLSLLFIGTYSFAQADSTRHENGKLELDTSNIEITSFLVFFATASHELDSNYIIDLDRITAQVADSKDSIQLFGYTDDVGSIESNQVLSIKRAEIIKTYFLEAGISKELIQVYSFGEEQPKADNDTKEGRAQNRRVEIKILAETRFVSDESEKIDTNLLMPDGIDSLQKLVTLPPKARMIKKPMPRVLKSTPVRLSAVEKHLVTSNGATVMLTYDYQSGAAPPRSILLQIEGASNFYDIPLQMTATSGRLNIPMSFPTQLGKGEIAVLACLFNKKGHLSAVDTTFLQLERLGTGKLQISLSWNDKSDQDLYVKTPTGEVISYQDLYVSNGGRLDRDDRDGFGPENIFWLEDAPDGEYTISVHDYDETSVKKSFVITLNGLGINRQFYGSTQNGSRAFVTRFEKNNGLISWK